MASDPLAPSSSAGADGQGDVLGGGAAPGGAGGGGLTQDGGGSANAALPSPGAADAPGADEQVGGRTPALPASVRGHAACAVGGGAPALPAVVRGHMLRAWWEVGPLACLPPCAGICCVVHCL